jgi:protein pelota
MVMEEGVAHLCYVKPSITLLVQKVDKNVSKKTSGQEIYNKSLNKFFLDCYRAIRTIDITPMKCFVIASPGFLNDQFFRYIQEQSQS